ncbi:MAG: sulfatase-like hydrolase/transferase, partial [Akkermansiaceae bacterium]|nr:sulfatase-like hydrolase/transferase [Akkermansiaceae bacterium]
MFDDSVVEKPRTFDKDAAGAPDWARPAPRCNYKMAQYHGMMKCIDDNVGRITRHLEILGLLDETILVFTADHGDMRGEHHRQNKGIPLEASAKVPFVIRYPRR